MPNADVGQLFSQPRHLADRGQVREQDAAGVQRRLGVLHDAPRLGEIEEDAIEVVDLDALVDVADLDVERLTSAPRKPSTLAWARAAKSSRIS